MSTFLSNKRRIISFVSVFLLVVAMFFVMAIQVQAASTDQRAIITDSQGLREKTETFYIKGSWWWFVQTNVKIDVFLACGQGWTFPGAQRWFQDKARFDVKVYKEDGKTLWKSYSNLSHGDSFKIPGGAGNYKVVVTSRLDATQKDYQQNGAWIYAFANYRLVY